MILNNIAPLIQLLELWSKNGMLSQVDIERLLKGGAFGGFGDQIRAYFTNKGVGSTIQDFVQSSVRPSSGDIIKDGPNATGNGTGNVGSSNFLQDFFKQQEEYKLHDIQKFGISETLDPSLPRIFDKEIGRKYRPFSFGQGGGGRGSLGGGGTSSGAGGGHGVA